MKFSLCLFAAVCAAASQVSSIAVAQEVDGSEISKLLTERDVKINKLTVEEQLKLRAAQKKAAEDPEVKAALAKRDQAIEEFRAALHKSMVTADPSLQDILTRIAVGNSPGF